MPNPSLKSQIDNPSLWMRGEVPMPLKGLAGALRSQSVQDMLNPRSIEIMNKMAREASPVFQKLQASGAFKGAMGGLRTVGNFLGI